MNLLELEQAVRELKIKDVRDLFAVDFYLTSEDKILFYELIGKMFQPISSVIDSLELVKFMGIDLYIHDSWSDKSFLIKRGVEYKWPNLHPEENKPIFINFK